MLACARRRRLWVALGILIIVVAVAGLGLYLWLVSGLPAVADLSSYTAMPSSYVYDRYGRLLFEMPPPHTGSHSPVPLAEVLLDADNKSD